MPRFKHWRCDTPGDEHDEAFMCQECWDQVCGIHAERSLLDEDWLCPICYGREQRRLALATNQQQVQEGES